MRESLTFFKIDHAGTALLTDAHGRSAAGVSDATPGNGLDETENGALPEKT